ncbi:A/G-specific adenine glycosylase [Botrimarina colliarenosi]|uniref:Adenine DNA glycosylase n=1 Tax=Botrimarina colliarenosi TaxID=2528001 RepID=A0A5C6AH57_9BACT|nr:A/G-specific adenine glycosylase [Botrimarina colliarenosi]TWT99324.1 A/G-specific adenine glycosylase [Botrimarina colliarenosi]
MTRRSEAAIAEPLAADWKRAFRRRLLAWYGKHARDLPWRRSRDPYRVWVSEVMLQQTQVDTVRPYFERFTTAFPTVAALAAADEQDVLRLWEGLGYYRRARSLHAAAKQVVAEHDGKMPGDVATLLTLPGIGRYTAGAIVSIAYDKSAPILEANTIRLFTRLVAYDGEPTSSAGQRRLWGLAEELLPAKEVARFNQALMELGALVCTPVEPKCDACPVEKLCRARAEGSVNRLAPTTKKLKFSDAREAAVVVRKGATVLVRQCAEGERWAGLWDFPRFAIDSEGPLFAKKELTEKVADQTGITCEPGALITTIKHGVTRFRITLECYEAAHNGGRVRGSAKWIKPAELSDLPLSVTGRKLAKLL